MLRFTIREWAFFVAAVCAFIVMLAATNRLTSNYGLTKAGILCQGVTWAQLIENASKGELQMTSHSFPGSYPSFGKLQVSGDSTLTGHELLNEVAKEIEKMYADLGMPIVRKLECSNAGDLMQVGFTWNVANRGVVATVTHIGSTSNGVQAAIDSRGATTHYFSLQVQEYQLDWRTVK